MATKTNKLGLTLPAGSETVNINVLNDNFSIIDEKVGSTIVYEGDFSTNEELLEKINAAYSMVDDNSVGHAKLRAMVEGLEIGGGTWHFTFYRTNATYGWLECGTYYGNYKYYRRLYEGEWEEWVDISPRPPVPAIHASQHAADGNDPLTPEMIGITTIVATDKNNDGNVVLDAYVGDVYAEHIGDVANPHNVTIGQIGAAPAEHIEDKNNPHNVTAAQIGARSDTWMPTIADIGAAPAGFGLGDNPQFIEADHKLSDYTSSGFYYWGATNTDPDKPFRAGEMLVVKRATDGYVNQIAFSSDHTAPHIKARKQLGGSWSAWVDWSPSAFAPSGYGLGGNSKEIDDWNTAIENGFYRSSASCINGPVAVSQYHGVMINYSSVLGNQFVFKTWTDGQVEIWSRRYYNDTFAEWKPVLTSDTVGTYAAPSGYGLGTSGAQCDDCNNATADGFYSLCGDNLKNGPMADTYFWFGSMFVVSRHGRMIEQMAFYENRIAVRANLDGVWTEWEYVNPRMIADIEYRTTERIDGKAVYKKRDSNGIIMYRLDGDSTWTHGLPGVAPASIISYTIAPSAVGELDTLLKSVYNAMGQNTRKFIYANMLFEDGLSGGIWQLTLAKTTNDYGFIIAESYTSNPSPLVKSRTIYGGAWGDWYDISANTFAPSGYGLGTSNSTPLCADANNAYVSGWFRVDESTANYNKPSGIMRVDAHVSGWHVHQVVYTGNWSSQYPVTLERWCRSGVWDEEWSWVNPPMAVGVEYRTTERYNGQAVYCKLVDCGALPNSTEKAVYHGCSLAHVVRYSAEMFAGSEVFSMPYTLNGVNVSIRAINGGAIMLYASYDASGFSAYVTVWYTKD